MLLGVALDATADNQCKGKIYLTIDTGSMTQAELIAHTLNEENVKATFFLANERTYRNDYSLDPSWDAYWKARADEGHAFGNHTWSHRWARRDAGDKVMVVDHKGNPDALDQKAFCDEMKKVNAAFKRATGRTLSGIWRAPGGRTTQNSLRFAASCGYPVHVHWDDAGFLGDELPSEQHSNKELLERALKNIKSGDVLVMHTGIWSRKEPFAPALKPLIQGLKAKGFCFATIDAGRR
jgi:peptidoglycan/xylan/chitin deacetylase (PgdA/CDA1 family)